MRFPNLAKPPKTTYALLVLLTLAAQPLAASALEEPPGTPKPDCREPQTETEGTLVKEPPKDTRPAAPECMHCGDWLITHSNRKSLVGRGLKITPTQVQIPGCGIFALQDVPNRGGRFLGQKISISDLCMPKGINGALKQVLIEIDASDARQSKSDATISVSDPESHQKLVTVAAWNLSAMSPCDGGGMDNATCHEALNKRTLSILELESQDIPPTKPSAKGPTQIFNAQKFAKSALAACIKQEAEDGFSPWPYARALSCQGTYLESKLSEVLAWNDCKAGYRIPGPDFLRSEKTPPRCPPPIDEFAVEVSRAKAKK